MKKLLLLFSILLLSACSQQTEDPKDTPATETETQTKSPTTEDTTPDQTPSEEQATVYTLAEISTHDSKDSCWTSIDGKVYDLTAWISKHPGGANNILKLCGTDGSSAFNSQHGRNNEAKAELSNFVIGDLTQ